MSLHTAQYVQPIRFSEALPDEQAWERRLLELGLHREAFLLVRSNDQTGVVRFWEPDRLEALRYLARLDMQQ